MLFLKDTGRRVTRHLSGASWLWNNAQEPHLAEFPTASPRQAAAGKHLPAEMMPVDPPEPVLLLRLLWGKLLLHHAPTHVAHTTI